MCKLREITYIHLSQKLQTLTSTWGEMRSPESYVVFTVYNSTSSLSGTCRFFSQEVLILFSKLFFIYMSAWLVPFMIYKKHIRFIVFNNFIVHFYSCVIEVILLKMLIFGVFGVYSSPLINTEMLHSAFYMNAYSL